MNVAVPLSDLGSHETLKKVRELEPIGNGLKLPPAIVNVPSDKIVSKQIGKNEHWKSFSIIDDSGNKVFTVKDWNYDDRNKAMKESDGNVEMLVSLEINNFNGSHLEGTTAYKSDFFSSVKEQSINKSVNNCCLSDHLVYFCQNFVEYRHILSKLFFCDNERRADEYASLV